MPEEELTPEKKFKRKAYKPLPVEHKLSEDDINSISLHIHDSMEESMTMIITS